VRRLAYGAIALLVIPLYPLQAQNPAAGDLKAKIDALKGQIFDARMAQQTFSDGLQHCTELDGKSFFYQLRRRILNLDEYFQSLENLAKAQVYNPEKKRPWTIDDAKQRWEQVKKEAEDDKRKCDLVQSLPELEKRLQELQQSTAASEKP
jgi:ABC-type phosphate transport system auxiliary subunit